LTSEVIAVATAVGGLSDEQAKAVQGIAEFGKTVVEEGGALARYAGRILGTFPEDAVGLVVGDPLRAIRTLVAAKLDSWVTRKLADRNVTDPQPISPSLAIPIMRAAYDETRPELQELWASLIAAAMDLNRKGFVRADLVATVKQLEPLDALVLKAVYEAQGSQLMPNGRDNLARRFSVSSDEMTACFQNLERLGCFVRRGDQPPESEMVKEDPVIGSRGRLLMRAVY
jgi:hypothetical protein